jgi:hypothetical protein
VHKHKGKKGTNAKQEEEFFAWPLFLFHYFFVLPGTKIDVALNKKDVARNKIDVV